MIGVFPGVHQHDGAGGDALAARSRERLARGMFVQRLEFLAVHADAAGDLHHLLVEHRRKHDRQIEQARARLIADPERIGEASIDHEQSALPLAFQERVGGDGRPHLHGIHHARRNRRVRRETEHGPDAGDGGVSVPLGVLAQQLMS